MKIGRKSKYGKRVWKKGDNGQQEDMDRRERMDMR